MVQMKSTSGRWPVRLFADWPGKVLLYQILLIPVSLHGCELPSQACCTTHTYSDRQDLILLYLDSQIHILMNGAIEMIGARGVERADLYAAIVTELHIANSRCPALMCRTASVAPTIRCRMILHTNYYSRGRR